MLVGAFQAEECPSCGLYCTVLLEGLYRDPEQIDGHVRPVADLSFKMDGQQSVLFYKL